MIYRDHGIQLGQVAWAFTQAYDILGHAVAIKSESEAFGEQVARVMRFFPELSSPSLEAEVTLSFVVVPDPQGDARKVTYHAYFNSVPVGHTSSYRKLLQLLSWQLWWCADELAEQLILLSGAVSKNGYGIILPGKSRSGKSCLTLALAQRGYRYYTDGITAIDASTKQLHAFPKTVGIRNVEVFQDLATRKNIWLGPEKDDQEPVWWNHPTKIMANPSVALKPYVTTDRYIHPADIGAAAPGPPIGVRYIIFPKYDPRAEPQLLPLAPEKAVMELVKVSRNLYRFNAQALRILVPLVEGAECFSLISNDLEDTVNVIDRLVGP